jgi:hypothetical protein
MQYLKGSSTPVLYIGRTVLKGYPYPFICVIHVATNLPVSIKQYLDRSLKAVKFFNSTHISKRL